MNIEMYQELLQYIIDEGERPGYDNNSMVITLDVAKLDIPYKDNIFTLKASYGGTRLTESEIRVIMFDKCKFERLHTYLLEAPNIETRYGHVKSLPDLFDTFVLEYEEHLIEVEEQKLAEIERKKEFKKFLGGLA